MTKEAELRLICEENIHRAKDVRRKIGQLQEQINLLENEWMAMHRMVTEKPDTN